jgi:hypothetical protein
VAELSEVSLKKPMIILALTTDKLQLITSAAGDIDVVCSYGEVDQSTPPVVKPFGKQLTTIVTAATTDILASPAASTTRTPEEMTIRNTHATVSNTVTVLYNANATLYEIHKVTLAPGEMVEYIRGIGWFLVGNFLPNIRNQSVTDQVLTVGTEAYLTGSSIAIPSNRPAAIGTRFFWRVAASKTAAGTAVWVFNVRFGTAGTTSDTARVTFTQSGTLTGVVDNATWEIRCVVRGPISASCIVAGLMEYQHHAAASAGWGGLSADSYQTTSGAFDITTAGMIVGLSFAPGASTVATFQVVSAECENI